MVSVTELISSVNPTATIYEVVRKANCFQCDTKGASDFSLLYVCSARRVASHEKHHKLVPRITGWDARYVSNVSCGLNFWPCLWALDYKVRV